jgi:Fur family zinc uptake transcriptional regulator
VADLLAAADHACRSRGRTLTAARRRVLELVCASHVALGAYDILATLNKGGGRVAPIAVYRALDFLIEMGLVHRLASRNAFIACAHPAASHGAQFLICDRCGTVAETADREIEAAVARGARKAGFAMRVPVVEIAGLCPQCCASGPPHA